MRLKEEIKNLKKITLHIFTNSPHYNEHVSYWIGATDKYFEGDFHWTDGRQFSFSSKIKIILMIILIF